MFSLLLDTTGPALMLAIADEQHIVPCFTADTMHQQYHSSLLVPQLQSLFHQYGVSASKFTRLVVNTGPGSFTGIRTGLTFAKTWGQVFPDLNLYAVDTFTLLASQDVLRNQSVTILLNAFRGQHYRAALKVDDAGGIEWYEAPCIQDNQSIPTITTQQCFIGQDLALKLESNHCYSTLADYNFFTPQAMWFLLNSPLAPLPISPWQNLEPGYLQLPHISTPKPKGIKK